MTSSPSLEFAGHNQYGPIAEKFQKFKFMPMYSMVQDPSYKKLLGELGNADVVDLACGEGFYTRMIRSMTTGRVVGIDLSPEMLELAKQKDSKGIQYMVGDCCQELKIDGGANFDLVSAVYLLNYGASKEMLLAFIKNAYNLLKPGGRFIGVTISPFAKTREEFDKVAKYGWIHDLPNEVCQDGDKLGATIKGPEDCEDFKLYNYYWGVETYEWAFREAGFVDLQWIQHELEEGEGDGARGHFQSYLENPADISFMAIKKM